jgi:hypothetical protein
LGIASSFSVYGIKIKHSTNEKRLRVSFSTIRLKEFFCWNVNERHFVFFSEPVFEA